MKTVQCKVTVRSEDDVAYEDDYKREVTGARVFPDELIRESARRFHIWVGRYESQCRREELALLGRHLYRLLFHGPVKKEFETTFRLFREQHANDANLRLRLILEFHEGASDLASLPWEFLFLPTSDKFAAHPDLDLILTRFAPLRFGEEALVPERTPLRILIAFASPAEQNILDPGDLIPRIQALQKAGHIEVTVDSSPTHEGLRNRLGDPKTRPHVFHFIGHGRAGEIALVKGPESWKREQIEAAADGRTPVMAHWIDAPSLLDLFTKQKPLLVFLHACQGATQPTQEGLRSIALYLARASIPAVVAMQYEISNEDARLFAHKFYEELGRGSHVDEAVRAARAELGERDPSWSRRRFGAPVVYLRSTSPIVFPDPGAEPERPRAEPATGGNVRCPNTAKNCGNWLFPEAGFCTECSAAVEKCGGKNCGKCGGECRHLVLVSRRACQVCGWGIGKAQGFASTIEVSSAACEPEAAAAPSMVSGSSRSAGPSDTVQGSG